MHKARIADRATTVEAGVEDSDLVALGSRVRALRDAACLTQEELAHAAGLHWTYIGQIERGRRNPSYRTLLLLARGLDVEPAALFAAPGTDAR